MARRRPCIPFCISTLLLALCGSLPLAAEPTLQTWDGESVPGSIRQDEGTLLLLQGSTRSSLPTAWLSPDSLATLPQPKGYPLELSVTLHPPQGAPLVASLTLDTGFGRALLALAGDQLTSPLRAEGTVVLQQIDPALLKLDQRKIGVGAQWVEAVATADLRLFDAADRDLGSLPMAHRSLIRNEVDQLVQARDLAAPRLMAAASFALRHAAFELLLHLDPSGRELLHPRFQYLLDVPTWEIEEAFVPHIPAGSLAPALHRYRYLQALGNVPSRAALLAPEILELSAGAALAYPSHNLLISLASKLPPSAVEKLWTQVTSAGRSQADTKQNALADLPGKHAAAFAQDPQRYVQTFFPRQASQEDNQNLRLVIQMIRRCPPDLRAGPLLRILAETTTTEDTMIYVAEAFAAEVINQESVGTEQGGELLLSLLQHAQSPIIKTGVLQVLAKVPARIPSSRRHDALELANIAAWSTSKPLSDAAEAALASWTAAFAADPSPEEDTKKPEDPSPSGLP
ncbi:MAG: hypothetical protein AAGJ31_01160 [Verrucomicrobiota bacterium]